MSTSVDAFSEALKRASTPIDPPPTRPSALDMSSAASSLDPSFAGHWHNNSQFTPPNTATETHSAHWYPPSPQMDNTPVSQAPMDGTWPVDQTLERLDQHNQPQSFFEADADFHQQAIAFSGTSQIHGQNEFPSPPQARTTYAGEAPQSRAPAVDDLFSETDQNEMPEFDEMDQDDNIVRMSCFGQQQTQNPIQQESNTSLQSISGLSQTPNNATLRNIRDFEDPGSHPSPTESQLIAEDFEFHNQLPEEIQISRFNDKAVRKALREVKSGLPRKQQWYAWSKAKQMLSSEPESAVREPLEWQYEYQPQNDTEMPQGKHTASEQIEDGIWSPPSRPISLGTTIHDRSGNAGEEDYAVGRQWVAQPFEVRTPSSPASTGGFALGQGDWHASKEAVDQDRLSAKPLGLIIKKIAEEQHTRRTSKDEVPEADQDRLSLKPLGSIVKKIDEEHPARRASEDEVPRLDQERSSAEPLGPLIKKIATEQLARRDSKDEVPIADQNHLSTQPLGPLIKKIANEQRARRDSEDNQQPNDVVQVSNRYDQLKITDAMKAKLLWRRDGSAHGLLSYGNGPEQDMTDLKDPSPSQTQTHLSPPLPPRMNEQLTSNSHNRSRDPDLLRAHTSTILRRSPSPSHSYTHIPPPINPNRRSPSPWIEHPGINRPDTPRPVPCESSPLRERDDIHASIEPETPFSSRVRERESTPAYTSRSPSPSPVSHLGASHTHANAHQNDVDMTDAPSPSPSPPPVPRIPTQHLPQNSSPDPLSNPLVHCGNTVTNPQTPLLQSSPLRPPPIPDSASIKLPKRSDKSRRRSVGGQISKPEKPRAVTKSAAGVQGSNVNKSRNVTRKVTQVAQKVAAKGKRESSKVAQAVKNIEEGIKTADGSPRRSGRIPAKKGGR
jgi:hypothetical protein